MSNQKDKTIQSKIKSIKVSSPKIFPDATNNSIQFIYLNAQNGKNFHF